jgi:hypothetical protein
MKFSIKSQEVNNNWYHKPDLKIVDLYPILKDKLTTVNIANDSKKGYYSVNVIEVENLEELMQLIEKIDCNIIVDKPILDEYNQHGIKGRITIYDDYME